MQISENVIGIKLPLLSIQASAELGNSVSSQLKGSVESGPHSTRTSADKSSSIAVPASRPEALSGALFNQLPYGITNSSGVTSRKQMFFLFGANTS